MRVFSKRAPVADEPVDEALLRAIPELGAAAAPASAPPDPQARMATLVAQMRQNVEQALAQELGRVEGAFAGRLHEMEERLDEARAALEAVRAENERLRARAAESERKIAALKEFASRIEKL